MLLKWAAICLVVSLVAALLGFTNLAVAAAGVARILFFAFLILFAILLVTALLTVN